MKTIERHWYIVLFAMFLLSPLIGCATDTSTCPSPVEYTREELGAFALEAEDMAKHGMYPVTQRLLGDYKAERAQIRACFN